MIILQRDKTIRFINKCDYGTMRNKFRCIFSLILTTMFFTPAIVAQPAENLNAETITFLTKDNVTIYGDLYLGSQGKAGPLVLAFHQGASNAGAEYAPLATQLLAQGYSMLAIDQRSGGTRLGGINRTVEGMKDGHPDSMCDAYLDLEAVLNYVKSEGFSGKRVVWGSSYSGAHVIRLGYENTEDIAGILAFSPASGGPMADCSADPYIADLKLPLLALRPLSEMEYEHVKQQLDFIKASGHQTFVSDPGTHGSSMLNKDRVKGSVDDTWHVVLEFLAKVFED